MLTSCVSQSVQITRNWNFKGITYEQDNIYMLRNPKESPGRSFLKYLKRHGSSYSNFKALSLETGTKNKTENLDLTQGSLLQWTNSYIYIGEII